MLVTQFQPKQFPKLRQIATNINSVPRSAISKRESELTVGIETAKGSSISESREQQKDKRKGLKR